ncbi:Respiratory nitrate reductase 2 beta chain [compost metagenome]
MRSLNLKKAPDLTLLEQFGMTAKDTEEMYRLLAIAKYEDRFVIPAAHREEFADLYSEQGACGFTNMMGGPGPCGG